MNQKMESSKPKSCFLRSTTAVSLNERFSQVLMDQLTQAKTGTFDPILLQQRGRVDSSKVVLLVKGKLSPSFRLKRRASLVRLRQRVRKSVWSRLGWKQVTRRLSARHGGFWSFWNKYGMRAKFTCIHRGGGKLSVPPKKHSVLIKKNVQELTAEKTQPDAHLKTGGNNTFRGRYKKGALPTRKQLDDQLDEYMSLSKRRLDAQLDEYMAMAGQADLTWD